MNDYIMMDCRQDGGKLGLYIDFNSD